MNKKPFESWVNISSLIASGLALWLTSWLVASYLILVCILLALGYWTFRFWKDRQAYRRLLSSFSHVHQLPHEFRDILVSEKLFEIYRHPEDHEDILSSSVLKVLDISASLFNRIVGVPCYAMQILWFHFQKVQKISGFSSGRQIRLQIGEQRHLLKKFP